MGDSVAETLLQRSWRAQAALHGRKWRYDPFPVMFAHLRIVHLFCLFSAISVLCTKNPVPDTLWTPRQSEVDSSDFGLQETFSF